MPVAGSAESSLLSAIRSCNVQDLVIDLMYTGQARRLQQNEDTVLLVT